ncbi:MAG: LysM peptidoglycan-binding domain-containing protein [Thermoanaerobaculia bacterium]|nr:LysM peptidoglycan-binding domain-containing protein [Thermoanaerobaculia bacterium]
MPTTLRGFLVFLSLVPAALPGAAAEAPPTDLHLVGDHWTAWNPPELPPEGANVHTIVRGDTLWELAQKYFGDPYLWPQIWEQNRWILDAHWIYPGDPLVVGIEVATADVTDDGTLADTGEAATGEDLGADVPAEPKETGEEGLRGIRSAKDSLGAPQNLGYAADLECGGYVADPGEVFPYRLIGSEHGVLLPNLSGVGAAQSTSGGRFGELNTARLNLADGDLVYVDGGRAAGLAPGQLLSVVEPQRLVRRTEVRGEPYGQLYRSIARLRVLTVQPDLAIAEVQRACFGVQIGMGIKLFEPEPIPVGRRGRVWPVSLPASAEALQDAPMVVTSIDGLVSLGQDHLVFINRSAEDDVLPGDQFTIYRLNRSGLPPVVLGELVVVSARGRLALARITESRYAVLIGDLLLAR